MAFDPFLASKSAKVNHPESMFLIYAYKNISLNNKGTTIIPKEIKAYKR